MRKIWDHLIPWMLVLAIGIPLGLWVRARLDEARAGAAIVWLHPSAWWLALGGGLVGWMLFHLRRQRGAAMAFTRVSTLGRVSRGAVARLASLPSVLRVLAIAAIAGALARPQTFRIITRTVDSIDVMVVMDMSKSMEETDMDPRDDRMDAAQYVVRTFVGAREGDRVGLAIFAEGAMLQCPLTFDMKFLDWVVADLKIGDVPESGTAIGDGLGMALGELKKSDAKSKVVVLLSDGDNNVVTAFTPEESAALARSMGVKVFTVLVGAESTDLWGGMSVNPDTMRMIADTTGGQFFRATDSEELNKSFAKVREKLDKDRRVVKERVPDQELFGPLVGLAALLLILEQILAVTRFPEVPMTFATPFLFVLGILAPFAVVAAHLWDRRRQRVLMERLGELAAVQRMTAARSPRRRAIKAVLAGLGLGGVLMAAAGPRVRGTSVTRRKGMDLVIALDVSKSMLVGDVQVGEPALGWPADMKEDEPRPAPSNARWVQGTRLERARQVVDALAEKLPDDRIGVVLFAGASIHFPFTDDEHLAIELLHQVGSSDLMGGSDIGEALHMGKCLLRSELDDPSVRCAGINRRGNGGSARGPGARPKVKEEAKEERGKAILVLSDGGESNPTVLQEVDQAHQLGISLFFVGVGSDKGGPVPDLDWEGKIAGAKKDAQGNVVKSRLDGAGLRALAEASGDASHYIEVGADGPFDIGPIVTALNQVQRGDLERTEEDRPHDVYHWFLFPGLMLLVIEAAVGMRRRMKYPEAVS